jgi:hypothetical protein
LRCGGTEMGNRTASLHFDPSWDCWMMGARRSMRSRLASRAGTLPQCTIRCRLNSAQRPAPLTVVCGGRSPRRSETRDRGWDGMEWCDPTTPTLNPSKHKRAVESGRDEERDGETDRSVAHHDAVIHRSCLDPSRALLSLLRLTDSALPCSFNLTSNCVKFKFKFEFQVQDSRFSDITCCQSGCYCNNCI